MTKGRMRLYASISGIVVMVVLINFLIDILREHMIIVYIGLSVVGVLLFSAVVWALYWFLSKIAAHHAQIADKNYQVRTRKLALEARRYAIDQQKIEDERAWELEQQQIRYEQRERQRAYELEQEQIRLKAVIAQREYDLRMMQAQMIAVDSNKVLVVRHASGHQEIVYAPPVRLPAPNRIEEITEPEVQAALPSPRAKSVPTAYDAIASGMFRDREIDEILLGFDLEGNPVWKTWKSIKAILILGLQGGGKTTTACWLLLQVLMRGGKMGLIDKHARSEEDSMYQKIKPFEPLFDIPVGDRPKAALRVIEHSRKILDSRLNGAPLDYPYILVVDEFSAIMRQASGDGDWKEVAEKLTALVEDYNFEGRKHKCHAICIGQAANASRTGGTEVRDTFNTRIVHGMRAKQAQLLGLTDQKKDVQKLENGQVYVDVEGRDDPFFIQVPWLSDEMIANMGVRLVAAIQRNTQELNRKKTVFSERSEPVQTESLNVPQVDQERSMNAVQNYVEPLNDQAQKVLELKNLNLGKAAIIEELWGAKKGGSAAYKQAELEYTQIIELLQSLDYLKVQ